MILTAHAIQNLRDSGKITIQPFDMENLGTISYKFSLGEFIIPIAQMQDSKNPSKDSIYKIPSTGMLLRPDTLYLASTHENLGSTYFAQMIFGVKRIATLGIYIDISANLGHIGAVTHWTLEITVVQPVVIYPRQPIGQIVFWCPQGHQKTYQGKYNHKEKPQKSMIWLELINKS